MLCKIEKDVLNYSGAYYPMKNIVAYSDVCEFTPFGNQNMLISKTESKTYYALSITVTNFDNIIKITSKNKDSLIELFKAIDDYFKNHGKSTIQKLEIELDELDRLISD